MTRTPYRGPWRKLRTQILQRDGGQCQIRLPGCTSTATQVDHIRPLADGGQWWDPANLRAACKNCNLARLGQPAPAPKLPPSRHW